MPAREYINIKVRLSSDITEDELEEKLTAAINQYGRDNIFTISLEGRYQPKEPYDRARLLAAWQCGRCKGWHNARLQSGGTFR